MQKLKEKIQKANKIVILSGAGLSAPSGIKTFRDNNGLWDTYRVEDVATIQAFITNPKLAWEFYDLRRSELPNVHPNEAHNQISYLQRYKDVTLLTQNVDDLLERAGCKNVIHLHGVLSDTKCTNCDYVILNDTQSRSNNYECPQCIGTLRPSVVLFGEFLPYDELHFAENVIKSLTKDDVLIIVGTSLEVYPVAYFPNYALENGVCVIEVNKKSALHGKSMLSFMEPLNNAALSKCQRLHETRFNGIFQIEIDCAEAFQLLFN